MSGVEVALDTSRRVGSLAVARAGELVQDTLGDRAHASDLLPRLEGLLERLGVARVAGRLALERVYVGTGPGSYTGLRIGLATARALAHATGAQLCGVPSFAALALTGLGPDEEGAVVLDARAGRFYHARYRRRGGALQVLQPPEALDLAHLQRRLVPGGPILGPGDLCTAAGLDAARLRPDGFPQARAILTLGRQQEPDADAPEPLYLMSFGRAAGPGAH